MQTKHTFISKIKAFFSLKTIRGQLIFAQSCMILLLTMLLGFSVYTVICSTLRERNRESYGTILHAADTILAGTLESYRDYARIILENSVVRDRLAESQARPGEGIFMDTAIFSALDDELSVYTNGVDGVDSLYLFDNEGRLFYEDAGERSMDVEARIHYGNILESGWYAQAMAAGGKEVFVGYDVLGGSEDTISCVKVLNDFKSLDKIGLLVLNIKKSVFYTVFRPIVMEKDMYGIFYHENGTRHMVYQSGRSNVYGDDLEEILENREQDYEITRQDSQYGQWELLHIVPKADIVAIAARIRLLVMAAGIVGILVMWAVTFRQVYHITEPLYQLRENIRLVGEGTYHFENSFRPNEVGIIGQEFQKMVRERIALKEKMQEEQLLRQRSELELLQSQINPHFLYNTLDTLYWLAIAEDKEDIADMTKALSDVFRLSLNQGKELITVKEELEFIQAYLYIQDIRFDGKFTTRIQMDDPSIYGRKITKLVLQPFVENAIYHGLEPKMTRGRLDLRGCIEDDCLVFEVDDDGVGMDVEADLGKGYAVQNIIKRIRLHYGENAGIRFESRVGEGTKVKIYLPLDKVEADTAGSDAVM